MGKRLALHRHPQGKVGRTRCKICRKEYERVSNAIGHQYRHHGANDRMEALIGLEDLEV